MARRDGMVDVELVDEPVGTAVVAPGPRRSLPDLTRWVPAALVLLSVAVLGLGIGSGARVRDRLADDALRTPFAAVPGLAPSLREPLVERWRTSEPMTAEGGVALTTGVLGAGSGLALLDVGTGQRLAAAPASLASGGRTPDCPARLAGAGPGLQVCEVRGSAERIELTTGDVVQDVRDRLVLLDPTTGGVRDLLVLPDQVIGWQVVDDSLVVAWQDAGTIVAERTRPLSHAVLWHQEVPGTHDLSSRQLTMQVANGVVALAGPFAVVLDVTDGRVLALQPAGPWNIVADPLRVTTGSLGFTVWVPWGGTWFDMSGVAGTFTAGRPVLIGVDDASAGEVALVSSAGALRAVDLTDGATLWSSTSVDRVLLRLGGRLLVQEGGTLCAVDLRSGEEQWSIDVPPGLDPAGALVTDGLRFLVPTPGAAGSPPRLTARRLADGAALWTVDAPAGTSALSTEGGAIVARGPGLAVILG